MKQLYLVLEVETIKGLREVFRHECPEPAYDMLNKWMKYKPTSRFELIRIEG